MAFPHTRMRRLRASASLRGLVRETELRAGQLVAPLFVSAETSSREPIEAMPGVDRLSISAAVEDAREATSWGSQAVLLFGIPAEKDAEGLGRLGRGGNRAARHRARSSATYPSCS